MPSLAFRKASICSRFSFSASCTLVVNPQHATRFSLILYWKLPPPSGSSCIGKDSEYHTAAVFDTIVITTPARIAPFERVEETLFHGLCDRGTLHQHQRHSLRRCLSGGLHPPQEGQR